MGSIFTWLMLALHIILIIAYGAGTDYSELSNSNAMGQGGLQVSSIYREYIDIHVMIFIGFGYLMTFLRSYMYGALSLNFIVGVFAILWGIITCGVFNQLIVGEGEESALDKIHLDIESLIIGDFSAAAALISFGAVLGKVSPSQLIFAIFLEMIFFSANSAYSYNVLQVADIGGTMTIHLFGACFGLGLSKVVSKKATFNHEENNSVRYSDTFSMVGTLFLFVYWPSFVGVLAGGNSRNRAILHTVLAISGSAMSAFFTSHSLRGKKFTMVDIQNATLAGGVTIGAVGNFVMTPAIALALGIIAGIVSTFGYVYIQPFLQNKIGLTDTCGVMNLHGMPAIIGAIASALLTYSATTENYGADENITEIFPAMPERSASAQAGIQITCTIITMVFATVTGILTGFIVTRIDPITDDELFFNDKSAFNVPASFVSSDEPQVLSLDDKIEKIESVFAQMTGTKIELTKNVDYFAKTNNSVLPL